MAALVLQALVVLVQEYGLGCSGRLGWWLVGGLAGASSSTFFGEELWCGSRGARGVSPAVDVC